MPARVHPGAVIHDWDHMVITLREGGSSGSETGFLSLYAITFSASLGAGHVALFEVPAAPEGRQAMTLSDSDGLGRRMQARLRSMGFDREPFVGDGFGFRILADDLDIRARWEEASPPFWFDGQGGAFSQDEDIWAMMVGANRASLTVNGITAPGEAFDDDVWVPKLGRSVSSAHAAFAEIRVQPVSGRATGSGSA
jgi:hypothetical protein